MLNEASVVSYLARSACLECVQVLGVLAVYVLAMLVLALLVLVLRVRVCCRLILQAHSICLSEIIIKT